MTDRATTSRRDFLKASAVAGVAMAGGLSLVRSAHAAGSERHQGGPDRLRRPRQRSH